METNQTFLFINTWAKSHGILGFFGLLFFCPIYPFSLFAWKIRSVFVFILSFFIVLKPHFLTITKWKNVLSCICIFPMAWENLFYSHFYTLSLCGMHPRISKGTDILGSSFCLIIVRCLNWKLFMQVVKQSSPSNRKSRSQPPPIFFAEPFTQSNSFVGTEEYIAPVWWISIMLHTI